MQSIKNDFSGGLNLDDSPYRVQPNAYIDAVNITQDAIEGSHDMVITNLVGNMLVDYTLPAGINKVIGAKANTVRDTVIYMVYNSNDFDLVLEYNNTTRTITKLLENITDTGGEDILGFTQSGLITSINFYNRDLEGDLCFFLDSLGRPTGFNIETLRNGVYSVVTRAMINVAKQPPLSPPECVYTNDTTIRSNGFRKKLTRYCYRYVYDDFAKSSCSPISAIPLPINILSDTYTNVITNNNAIDISLQNGKENVAKIELYMSLVEASNTWQDFVLIKTINAKDYAPDAEIVYRFYNDGVYPTIDIFESPINHLFDWVPPKANAQEMPNGDVLMYAGITEGYDRDLEADVQVQINTIAAGGGSQTGSLNGVNQDLGNYFGIYKRRKVTFTGLPATGTLVEIKLLRLSDMVPVVIATYTTAANDTATIVATNLRNSLISIGIADAFGGLSGASFEYIYVDNDYNFIGIEITPPALSSASNSIPTFQFSTSRVLGLTYFDKEGRTNGVVYNQKVTFPAYAENGSQEVLLPYISTTINHQPFEWAHSYQWVMTKEGTNFLYWYTVDVNTTESGYLYFDISNLPLNQKKFPTTTEVLSYTFQDGDRMRLIKRDSDNVVFNDTYDAQVEGLVVDPIINGVSKTGTFIKIKKVAPFSSVDYTSKNFIIQLYRPNQQSAGGEEGQLVFYEFSAQFPVLDAGLPTRAHGGNISNQDITSATPALSDFYNGDVYFRTRNVVLSESGSATFNVIDRNFVDIYISAVNDIDGRPSVIDENARQAYYGTLVRFGQAYQANTNINGLNRFYPNNFDEYDVSFGEIKRLSRRDRYIRVFQKLKVGVVPIYNQISKNADGTQLLVVTDKLLNPIQYYNGDYGIGDHPESLTSYNFADYFVSNIQGVICRVSNDGVTPISVEKKINSWATKELPIRGENTKIYGAFIQRLNKYIIVLESVGDSAEKTLTFSETKGNFESFITYYPEMMVTLGTLFIGFKDGQLWTHDSTIYNNFFGVQYSSSITPVFNQAPAAVKSFMAIEEKANSVWACPEIETSLMSYGNTPQQSNLIEDDFDELEGKWCAPFLRDKNSIGGIEGGNQLKGDWIKIKMQNNNATNIVTLNLVSVRVIDSPLNNR